MKKTIAAFFWLIAAPATANEYKWIGQVTEDGSALTYAIPNSDAIKIDFHCDRKTRKIVVNLQHEPKDAKDGMSATIRISLRGREAGGINIAATGQRLELDDSFAFQGETRMSPQLRAILVSEGTMQVAIGGQTEEIPLQGAGRVAQHLFRSCPG